MIRFLISKDNSDTTIGIAGRLEASHLSELESHWHRVEGALVLELSELQTADPASIRWLSKLEQGGTPITGASPYIRLLLRRARESGTRCESDCNDKRQD